MSTSSARADRTNGPRYSADDRLEPRAYEHLLRGALELDPEFSIQAELAILAAGRLGMRSGEIAHLREEWIDWRDQKIHVPHHEPCTKGRDGGVCGHCRQLGKQKVDADPSRDLDGVLARMWQPKTDAASRAIPFGHDARTELALDRFFDRYDAWPISHNGVGRRIKRAARSARELDADEIYAHCLRATAATFHAGRGLSAIHLQALMGWKQLDTAQHYVRMSGDAVASALERTHR